MSNFEGNDGDMVHNDGGTDWDNAPNLTTQDDLPTGTNDDSFGQGTKEDDTSPTVVTGSIPNNKSDLLQFSVSHQTINGIQFMYLRWVRANTLGTANIDFEFDQSSTLSSNGVTYQRTGGDLLITYDFDSGGKDANKIFIHALRWVTSGSNSQCQASGATVPCWGNSVDLVSSGFANGAINAVAIADPIRNLTSIPQFTFGEVAIDLTDSGLIPPNSCNPFTSAYAKSRASTSFTAELKDFIPPHTLNFSTCGQLNIHKEDDFGNNLQGAVFTLFSGDPSLVNPLVCTGSSLGKSCTTDASGDCSITDIPQGGDYCLAETTTPSGFFTANAQNADLPNGTASLDFTFVNRTARTVKIVKVDDAATPASVDGAVFTLKQGTTTLGSCTTLNGTCSISGLDYGSYTLFETTVPAGYFAGIDSNGLAVTINSSSPATIEEDITDPRKFRVITIVCREYDHSLYSSPFTFDGGAPLNSISAPPAGVTENTLCTMGGATVDSLHQGNTQPNINFTIP